MKTKLGLFLLVPGLIFTLSCTKYPPSTDRLLEDLAVITQYDTKVNFTNYKTYSLATSITKITDKDTTAITGQTTTAILDQIDKNMKAMGYTKAATGAKPDLGIQVLYFQNTTVYTYYYDWWGYYPYGGYYYPYYPVYYASYTTGLVNIQMIDLKYPDNNRLAIRWNAYIRGLLTGTHTTTEITGRVDQAFIQTPQIRIN